MYKEIAPNAQTLTLRQLEQLNDEFNTEGSGQSLEIKNPGVNFIKIGEVIEPDEPIL